MSKFKKLLETHSTEEFPSPLPAETLASTSVLDQSDGAPKPVPKKISAQAYKIPESTLSVKPTFRSSHPSKEDPIYTKTTLYIRQELLQQVKQHLLQSQHTTDLSELVETLLESWLQLNP